MMILNMLFTFLILSLLFSCASLDQSSVKVKDKSNPFPMTSADRWNASR